MDTKKSAPITTCHCGCEGSPKSGRRFLPGHDAKLKSTLVKAALGGSKRAATKLGNLGWSKFLDAAKARPDPKQKPQAATTTSADDQ